MGPTTTFWHQDCIRGPGLSHTHRQHVGNERDVHDNCPCMDCGLTPQRWASVLDVTMREALVDPDSLPLALPQAECIGHGAYVRATLDKDGEWAACPNCLSPLEPKLVTGVLSGPSYAPGRGWITPRMKLRWNAIAHRAMRDNEANLPPLSSYR